MHVRARAVAAVLVATMATVAPTALVAAQVRVPPRADRPAADTGSTTVERQRVTLRRAMRRVLDAAEQSCYPAGQRARLRAVTDTLSALFGPWASEKVTKRYRGDVARFALRGSTADRLNAFMDFAT